MQISLETNCLLRVDKYTYQKLKPVFSDLARPMSILFRHLKKNIIVKFCTNYSRSFAFLVFFSYMGIRHLNWKMAIVKQLLILFYIIISLG